MIKTDEKIKEAKQGNSVLLNMVGEYSFYIVYLFGEFFLETYKYNKETKQTKLERVECIDEKIARIALNNEHSVLVNRC